MVEGYIDRYLTGQCDRKELERWLVEHLQAILDSGNEQAIKLANQVDAALIEIQEGLLTEEALKRRLAGLLGRETDRTIAEVFPKPDKREPVVSYQSSNATRMGLEWEVPVVPVDLPVELVHQFE